MIKSYFWVLHLLMIAVGAYFVADMANQAVGARLEASIEIPKGAGAASTGVASKGGASSDYALIVEGNIFNSKMRGRKPEGEPSAQPLPAASKVPLNLTLIGTVVGGDEASYAVIEDGKTKEQTLYQLWDLLVEDAKIIQIIRNQVVIRRGTENEILEISLDPSQSKPAEAHPTPTALTPVVPAGAGIRQISTNRWVLDRREIESAVDNLPQLLTKARIIPNFNDGKPDGFRIFAITDDSLYTKIGLQNGDVLYRVNGIEVKDPQNFLKVFQQLKDESSVTVDLARNNQKETFSYEIR